MADGWAWVSLSAYSSELSATQVGELLPDSVASSANAHLAAVPAALVADLAELRSDVMIDTYDVPACRRPAPGPRGHPDSRTTSAVAALARDNWSCLLTSPHTLRYSDADH